MEKLKKKWSEAWGDSYGHLVEWDTMLPGLQAAQLLVPEELTEIVPNVRRVDDSLVIESVFLSSQHYTAETRWRPTILADCMLRASMICRRLGLMEHQSESGPFTVVTLQVIHREGLQSEMTFLCTSPEDVRAQVEKALVLFTFAPPP